MNYSHPIRSAARVAVFGVLTAVLWAAGSVLPARACTTPVFRYAMYNWSPAPYYVFYFHHGQVAEEDRQVNKLLDEAAEADPPANVVLTTIDVSEQEQFERLPRVVKKIYQKHADGQQPLHLAFSPWVMMYAWYAEQYARASEEADQQDETPEEAQPEAAAQTDGPAGESNQQEKTSQESQPEAPDQTAAPPDEDKDQRQEASDDGN